MVLATLGLLEIGLRFMLGNLGMPALDTSGRDGRCIALEPGTSVDYTGYTLRVPTVHNDVSSLGYRGRERPVDEPENTLRILLVGDSFTYGMGVEADETIGAQMERILEGRISRNVEVLNFGIPGINLEESLEQYRLFASKWKHDLVLYDFFDNDFEPPLCDQLSPRLSLWLLKHFYVFRPVAILFWGSLFPSDYDTEAIETRLSAALGGFVDKARESGAAFGVVMIGGNHNDRDRKDVGELAARLGFHWFDVNRECSREIPEIPFEHHYTVEGNRVVAACLADWLERTGLSERR